MCICSYHRCVHIWHCVHACPNNIHGTILARPSSVPQATLPGDIRSLRMRSVLRAWGPQNGSCAHFSPQFGSPRLVTTALPGPEESCMSLVLLRPHTGGNYCPIQTDSAHHVLHSLGEGVGDGSTLFVWLFASCLVSFGCSMC